MEFEFVFNLNTLIVPSVVSLSTAYLVYHANRKDKKRDEHENEV